MYNWLIYSLTATLFYGLLNFLYKVAAEKKYINQAVILISATTVVFAAFTTILISGRDFSGIYSAAPYALANGTLFAFGALSKFKALKLAPASVVFPVNKSNILFVIIIGILFFDESPSLYQWLGIGSSVLVLILISSEQINLSSDITIKGIYFALIAAVCTSLSMTAGKMASIRVDRTIYIMLSYSIVVLVSYLTFRKRTTDDEKQDAFKKPGIFLIGGSIGILNYFGYRLVLSAFASGSMSLVQPILALSILIPIFLSALIYREKLTYLRIISIGLTLASILLIKNG
jgi:uncharacterized membrane protein